MKDILELLHPLCLFMGLIGILIAIIEFSISQKIIWKIKQLKTPDPYLFGKHFKEIHNHLRNAHNALATTVILLVLTIFIHLSIM